MKKFWITRKVRWIKSLSQIIFLFVETIISSRLNAAHETLQPGKKQAVAPCYVYDFTPGGSRFTPLPGVIVVKASQALY